MSKHRSIYGPMAGRFLSLEQCPLWEETGYYDEEDQPETAPNYYGQTRRLAEDTGGSLIDLAGGCVGVVVREHLDGSIVVAALSPDDGCETIAFWVEDSEGEQRGEPTVVPFRPYVSEA